MTTQTETATPLATSTTTVVAPSQEPKSSKPVQKTPSQVVSALYRGEGALTGEALASVLSLANNVRGTVAAFPQASKDADAAVDAAMSALTAARDQAKSVAKAGGEANAILARVLYLVATKDVRGEVSISGKDLAAAWGVSAGFISQYVGKGRLMYRLGQTSAEAYAIADKAYRAGKDAVAALTATAQGIAAASVDPQHEGEVRVSLTAVKEAADQVFTPASAPAVKAPAGTVRATAVTKRVRDLIDAVNAASKAGTLVGTPEDQRHAIKAAQDLAEALRHVTVTDQA